MNDFEEKTRPSFLGQWIVSLAVSVICCAAFFVIVAFYMADQKFSSTIAPFSTVALRIDLLQQRQDRLANELDLLRRSVLPAQFQPQDGMMPPPSTDQGEEEGVILEKGVETDIPAATGSAAVRAPTMTLPSTASPAHSPSTQASPAPVPAPQAPVTPPPAPAPVPAKP